MTEPHLAVSGKSRCAQHEEDLHGLGEDKMKAIRSCAKVWSDDAA